MITILILAAGQGARMRGGDKLLEPVEGQPCLTTLTQRALASGADVLVIVPNLDHPRAKAAWGARLVPSPDADLGMAHSIRAGIAALPAETTALLILPGDMPEIETGDLQAMMTAFQQADVSILQAATEDGTPGHPVMFAAPLLAEIANLTGDKGAASVIAAHKARRQLFPLGGQRARLDLDTPEDWAAWRAASTDQ